jgi:ribosome biogenesis protein UTP30
LFVRDLKKGRRLDYENTVHHYENILQQHGCTQVKTIIPLNQVKTEYRQFEMRRRLLNSYDFFLVDGRISGHMAHLLGKSFRKKRKLPTSIHMDKQDLKTEIDNALKKTSLQLHRNGDCSITQIGNCSMDIEKVSDNLVAVVKHLKTNFPGGWENIRSLRIKTPLSLAIPIYITLSKYSAYIHILFIVFIYFKLIIKLFF